MNIVDPDLRQHVERLRSYEAGMSEEHQFVTALFDAYGFFRTTRGDDAAPTQESIRCLASSELRPAVRRWYQSFGPAALNPVAADFRTRLSQLAGEPL